MNVGFQRTAFQANAFQGLPLVYDPDTSRMSEIDFEFRALIIPREFRIEEIPVEFRITES